MNMVGWAPLIESTTRPMCPTFFPNRVKRCFEIPFFFGVKTWLEVSAEHRHERCNKVFTINISAWTFHNQMFYLKTNGAFMIVPLIVYKCASDRLDFLWDYSVSRAPQSKRYQLRFVALAYVMGTEGPDCSFFPIYRNDYTCSKRSLH